MVHHWRWHGSTRVPRWTRLTVAVSLLIACILLAGIPAAASASTPEMRGEWALTMESSEGTLHGIAHFTQEANPKGEFAAQSMAFETFIEGTFTGTLEGATATVETTSKEFGPVPAGKFKSKTMKVEEGAGTLALSGEGELKLGTKELTAKFTATRIKSGKQIEEQEAREAREREEAEERAAVRGEWSLTLESGPTVLKGTALITEAANTKSEFASSSALVENSLGTVGATFSGTLAGSKTLVTITTEAAGPAPPGAFTSSTIALTYSHSAMSMSGSGVFKIGEAEFPATLSAARVKTYQQVLEREKAEREAKEKQEKEAQEAAEKVAREKKEQEQKAKELKEAQERKAREEAAKVVVPKTVPLPLTIPPLVPVAVGAKAFTLSSSGAISLGLTNPGDSTEHGHLKLTLTKGGKASSAKHSSSTLGEASFSIAPHGSEVVKVKLSKSGRAQLSHHKSLRVLLAVTTQASGQPTATKSYTVTLRAPTAHHKG